MLSLIGVPHSMIIYVHSTLLASAVYPRKLEILIPSHNSGYHPSFNVKNENTMDSYINYIYFGISELECVN